MSRLSRLARAVLWATAVAGVTAPALARAREGKDPRLALVTPHGRPRIAIDRIDLPPDVGDARGMARYLRQRLLRESRRARWGAGRNNVIQFRFALTELSVRQEGDVLRVRCTAVGKLPGGQAAKSHLSLSGDPRQRRKVVEHVLDIVARGVVTRLAELERIRRGDLQRSGVRPPRAVD